VVSKRPDLFLKQPTLVDYICTNLLFTSKHQDKSNSASVLKPKSLQMIRNSINQNASISTILFVNFSLIYMNMKVVGQKYSLKRM
jgi:hypothetical protein